MQNDSTNPFDRVTRIDKSEMRGLLDSMVRGSVEGTLNMMLGAEAGESCQAQRYDRSENQIETWTGHDTQKGLAEACEVALSMPKLRRPNLGAAIIVR